MRTIVVDLCLEGAPASKTIWCHKENSDNSMNFVSGVNDTVFQLYVVPLSDTVVMFRGSQLNIISICTDI